MFCYKMIQNCSNEVGKAYTMNLKQLNLYDGSGVNMYEIEWFYWLPWQRGYPFKAQWYVGPPPAVSFSNPTLCPRGVFMA